MLQSRFDRLRERLLRAGIAPRHVRRYVTELRDHFEDLVREEAANGAARDAAEANARARLGNDNDLAEVMLERPGMRSLASRYPWAVFGLGPVVLVFGALFGTVLIEAGVFNLVATVIDRSKPTGHPPPELFVSAINAWNWIGSTAAPLLIAATLCMVGLRQRMKAPWIFTGIAISCFLGAFQALSWSDDGHHGELSLGSAFLPPYPMHLIEGGVVRAVVTVALAGAIYWIGLRRQNAGSTVANTAFTQAAE